MALRLCRVLRFECELTSPFHTTQRGYGNLLKCAPHIPGSTLRGTILKHMIEQRCPSSSIETLKTLRDYEKISQFHQHCTENCPIKLFFPNATKPNAIFSFGNFSNIKYSGRTRIALNRRNRAVSEGRLVNVESISPSTHFEFNIILFESAFDLIEELRGSVKYIGKYSSIGKFKSIGFGKFKVSKIKEDDLDTILSLTLDGIGNAKEKVILLTTPLIFSRGSEPFNIEPNELAKTLSSLVRERAYETRMHESLNNIPTLELKNLSARINPEFVSRFSYEVMHRDSRLSAWLESEFIFELTESNEEMLMQIVIASVCGMGDWRDVGYGKFDIKR